MFKKITLFSLSLVLFTCLKSFSQQYKWGKMLTGTHGLKIESYTNDNAGNSYVYAQIAGDDTVDVDPGPGVHNLLASVGPRFIAKYNGSGDLVWVKQTGGYGQLYNSILKIDPSNNNLVVFGNNYSGTSDFDFSSAVFSFYSDTGGDLIIAKYSSADCSFISAKRIISTYNNVGDNAVSVSYAEIGPYAFRRYAPIDIDNQGNITIAGSFIGAANFDLNNPSSTTYNIGSYGLRFPFIVKYDNTGNLLWLNYTTGGYTDIFSIKSDATGNIYALGRSSTTWYGGSLPSPFINNAITIQKFGNSPNPTWTKEILLPTVLVDNNNAIGSYPTNLSLDQNNNIFISGYFTGTVDFDPGAGVSNLNGGSATQGFLAKYNSSGDYTWAKNQGNVAFEYMKANTANKLVTITYTGAGGGDIDFGTGTTDTSGFFLSIYDTAANMFSYQRIDDSISYVDMAVNADNIFLWGNFNVPIDLDLSTPLGSFTPIPPSDDYGIPQASFFSKFNGCKPNNTVITDSICQGSSYAFNGQPLNAAGVYSYTLPASATCDSVIVLDLSTYVITGSEQISICQGATYNFGGQQISTSGTYNHSFTTASGCDSVATLHLIVNSIDTVVTKTNNTLTANANNAIYQWLNCSNNTVIQGANGKNFTPSASGSYKVVVTQNGCSDTSNCYSVNITGINQPEFAKHIQLFPNPVNSKLNINYSATLPLEQVAIMDITGRTIQIISIKDHTAHVSVDVQQLQAGVYFLKIIANGEQAVFKFVKQ